MRVERSPFRARGSQRRESTSGGGIVDIMSSNTSGDEGGFNPAVLSETIRNAVREALAPPLASTPFAEIWSWWRMRFLSRLAKSRDTQRLVELHLLPGLGQLTEETMRPDVIELHFTELETRLSPGTINNVRARGRKIIYDAIKAGCWHRTNPFAATHKRRVPRAHRCVLSLSEARALVACASRELAPRWAVLIGLGLRYGEFRALRVGDWNARARQLTVRRSGERDTTKTGQGRVIPVPDWLAAFIDRAVKRARGDLLFPGDRGRMLYRCGGKSLDAALRAAGIIDGGRFFCMKRGCDFSERRARVVSGQRCPKCRRALHVSLIPRAMRVHDLRHTFVTLGQEVGIPLPVISAVAGHSSRDTTSGVYTHLRANYIRTQLAKLNLTAPEPAMGLKAKSGRPSRGSADPKQEVDVDVGRTLPRRALLSTAEVGTVLGLDDSSVRRLIHHGKLPAYAWGKDYRVSPEDLEAFLSRSRVEVTP
jgi:excisionase family DNA binding protein